MVKFTFKNNTAIIHKVFVISFIAAIVFNCRIIKAAEMLSSQELNASSSLQNGENGNSLSERYDLEDVQVLAPSAAVIDVRTGAIIYDKNMHEKNYPASMTKVMTLLLTIEYVEAKGGDYRERITMSENAVFNVEPNSTNINMQVGETLAIEDAIYSLMLASANEVANGLAEHIAGSTEQFGVMMTNRARELGCEHTNFMNPNGLHNEEHYTTAYDMAMIMREAVKLDKFVKVINTTSYEIPAREKHPKPLLIKNNNLTIQPGDYYVPEVVGGKSGFTDEAQYPLVSYAKKEEMEIICAVMRDERFERFNDTKTLADYAFKEYGQNILMRKGEQLISVDILHEAEDNAKEDTVLGSVFALCAEDIYAFVPNVITSENISKETIISNSIQAPVFEGDVIGKVILKYNETELAEADLIASTTIEAPPPKPIYIRIFESYRYLILTLFGCFILITFLLILRRRSVRRKKARYHLRYKTQKYK